MKTPTETLADVERKLAALRAQLRSMDRSEGATAPRLVERKIAMWEDHAARLRQLIAPPAAAPTATAASAAPVKLRDSVVPLGAVDSPHRSTAQPREARHVRGFDYSHRAMEVGGDHTLASTLNQTRALARAGDPHAVAIMRSIAGVRK